MGLLFSDRQSWFVVLETTPFREFHYTIIVLIEHDLTIDFFALDISHVQEILRSVL